MIAGLPFTLFISDSRLLSLLTDLRLLLTFKRPTGISPFPYTFLYAFQLHSDTQLVAVGQQPLRNTELEVCQQDTKLTEHFPNMLLPYLLALLGDREVPDDILHRPFHLYRRTFDTVNLRHSLNGWMQDIKQVLCVGKDRIFVILRFVAARFLVFVHFRKDRLKVSPAPRYRDGTGAFIFNQFLKARPPDNETCR